MVDETNWSNVSTSSSGNFFSLRAHRHGGSRGFSVGCLSEIALALNCRVSELLPRRPKSFVMERWAQFGSMEDVATASSARRSQVVSAP